MKVFKRALRLAVCWVSALPIMILFCVGFHSRKPDHLPGLGFQIQVRETDKKPGGTFRYCFQMNLRAFQNACAGRIPLKVDFDHGRVLNFAFTADGKIPEEAA